MSFALRQAVKEPRGGYVFNGSSTRVDSSSGTLPVINYPFTVSAWISWDGTVDTRIYWSMGSDASTIHFWWAGVTSLGYPQISWRGDGTQQNIVAITKMATHRYYCVTWVGESAALNSIYVNGRLENRSTASGGSFSNSAWHVWGALKWTTGAPILYYGGTVVEPAIWNRALTSREVFQACQQGSRRYRKANLVFYRDWLRGHESGAPYGTGNLVLAEINSPARTARHRVFAGYRTAIYPEAAASGIAPRAWHHLRNLHAA